MSAGAGTWDSLPADALRPRSIALLGNPNCGKTTIFNALTGLRQKVGNYPGVTVEKRAGVLRGEARTSVIDLPGTYSLVGISPDEKVVAEVLRSGQKARAPDVVLAVVDASNLVRNLYLVSQLLELGLPVVVGLTMGDIAARRHQPVDAGALGRLLGCEVIPIVAHRRQGIDALRAALDRAVVPLAPLVEVPPLMLESERVLAQAIAKARSEARGTAFDPNATEAALGTARRLLIGDESEDLREIRSLPGIATALSTLHGSMRERGVDPMQSDIEGRYAWVERVAAQVVGGGGLGARSRSTRTDRVDAVVIHPMFGFFVFAAVMTGLFVGVFWMAKPLSLGVQTIIARLAAHIGQSLSPGPLRDLLIDGVFGGVGAVLGFVPQVGLLFLLLAVLEDSGYLARAAFLMDRLLASIGLHGKSFIPLLSSFGCAIPGILATRTIDNGRDRLATILVAPFMSCSARLPVYTLLIGVCFVGLSSLGQGLVMVGLYLAGIVAAVAAALIMRRRLSSGSRGTFILELPTYKIPQPGQALWQAWTHTRAFVARAGTTILAMSVVVWALLYYPRLPSERLAGFETESAARAAQVEYSLAGRLGHQLEPALRPLGFDWKIGVGLLGAFAAREVFVATLGVTYRVETGAGQGSSEGLVRAMLADRSPDNRPVWTPLTAVSLMVWFVLAMQCMSTVAVVRREAGGWRWALAQLAVMNVLAYAACLLVFQIGTRVFGAS